MSLQVRELPANASRFLVNGQTVNPWLMGIDFKAGAPSTSSVELHLDLSILIFEMEQYEIMVSRDTVRQFVSDDMRSHNEIALDGYLTIVRYVLNPPPRRKSFGWFARMFTPAPKWTPPAQQWKWISVGEIRVTDEDTLVIQGRCCPAAKL